MELCESCGLPELVILREAGLPEGTDIDWAVQQSGQAIFFEQKPVGRGDSTVHLKVGQHLFMPILSRAGLAFVLLVEIKAGERIRPETPMWLAEWQDLPAPQWGGVTVKIDDRFVPTSGAGLVRGVQQWKEAAENCVCGQGRLESDPSCFRPVVVFGFTSGDGSTGWAPFDWRVAFFDPDNARSTTA